MVQRVEYAVFPGAREENLVATVNKVIGHVRRSQLSKRDFREWLKDESIWDKTLMPKIARLIDLREGKIVRLGAWAETFFAAETEEDSQTLLFKRLVDENTLLVKYVMEALDMEGGGRLHSTHELHRMISSYVYPGTPIGLVDFQAWIKWMVASGRIKLIGIRWGLTPVGKELVPRLRMIETEEFLEEERDDDDADEDDGAEAAAGGASTPSLNDAASVSPPAGSAAAAPAPAHPKEEAVGPDASAAGGSDEAPPDEELPDLPPDAPPVDEAIARQYEADLVAEAEAAEDEAASSVVADGSGGTLSSGSSGSSGSAGSGPASSQAEAGGQEGRRGGKRRRTTPASVSLRDARLEVGCSGEAPSVPELIATLREIGRDRGLGGGSLLRAAGLETRMAEDHAARHLFLAALVARLHGHAGNGDLLSALLERTGGLGPVAVLLDRPEALPEVIIRWSLAHPDPVSAALRALLLDAVLGGRALAAQPDLPTVLAEATTAEQLVGELNRSVLRGSSTLTQLWLVREMVRVGSWKRAPHVDVAFVPWRQTRLMAYRLRLIDSHFAVGAAAQIAVARALAPILPAGSVEAQAFELLAWDDHLRFDCSRVPICQEPCALAERS